MLQTTNRHQYGIPLNKKILIKAPALRKIASKIRKDSRATIGNCIAIIDEWISQNEDALQKLQPIITITLSLQNEKIYLLMEENAHALQDLASILNRNHGAQHQKEDYELDEKANNYLEANLEYIFQTLIAHRESITSQSDITDYEKVVDNIIYIIEQQEKPFFSWLSWQERENKIMKGIRVSLNENEIDPQEVLSKEQRAWHTYSIDKRTKEMEIKINPIKTEKRKCKQKED